MQQQKQKWVCDRHQISNIRCQKSLVLTQHSDNEICAVLCLLVSSDGFPPIVPVGRRPSHPLCELCPPPFVSAVRKYNFFSLHRTYFAQGVPAVLLNRRNCVPGVLIAQSSNFQTIYGARNRVGKGLSYRPAGLHSLAELIH